MALLQKTVLAALIAVVAGISGPAASARHLAMGGLFRSLPKHIGSPLTGGSPFRGAGRSVLQAASGSGGSRAAAKEWGKKVLTTTATVAQQAGSRTVTLARTFPEAYVRAMQTRPIVVCGVLEGLRYLVGDIVSQRIEHKSQDGAPLKVELDRLSVLTAWGTLYGATLGYQSYHNVYPALFGIVGTRAALRTTCFDLLLTCPFVYYPAWHLFKEATDRAIHRDGPSFR